VLCSSACLWACIGTAVLIHLAYDLTWQNGIVSPHNGVHPGGVQGAAYFPDSKERLQQSMLQVLEECEPLCHIPPDCLALLLAGTASLGLHGARSPCRQATLAKLHASPAVADIQRAVVACMPSMHANRAVLAVLALDHARCRTDDVTAAFSTELMSKMAEAAPWAVARAVVMVEVDEGSEHVGHTVDALYACVLARMKECWGHVEFAQAGRVAVDEVQTRRVQAGQKKVSRLVRILDAGASAALNRFEQGRVFEMLALLHDAGLEDGQLLKAYVDKTNTASTA
jgi:hypothetical protein